MTERDLRKLEGTIRTKMEDIKKQRVTPERVWYRWVNEFIKEGRRSTL